MMTSEQEWLEVDGLGGLAMGAVDGVLRRRYHALLQVRNPKDGGRYVLVNGMETHLTTAAGRYPLSSHCYSPGLIRPDSRGSLLRFDPHPWPTWHQRAADGTELIQEILVRRGSPATVVTWRLADPTVEACLTVRLLISGRDAHGLHQENPHLDFAPAADGDWLAWEPYAGVPGFAVGTNAAYHHDPDWYRNFRYNQDMARGYDFEEDLASPGQLTWDLGKGPAVLILAATGADRGPGRVEFRGKSPARLADEWKREERERRGATRNQLFDGTFVIGMDDGDAVVGGWPWFGEDLRAAAFLARYELRLPGGMEQAGRIIGRGMRMRPGGDDGPVDGHFWMMVAAYEYLERLTEKTDPAHHLEAKQIRASMTGLLAWLAGNWGEGDGRPRLTADGLLQVGPARTWMNGRIGDRWSTPRDGKPVELQVLWLNALRIGALIDSSWEGIFENGLKTFRSRFWNRETDCLYDVIDGESGPDPSIRPNQLLAIGGLPFPVLQRSRAAQVLKVVEENLLTPAGLRTLDPRDRAYRGFCRGGEWEREAAMHQGTAWFWLLGPFVEGWLRVFGRNEKNLSHVRRRFLEPAARYRGIGVAGHLPEMADGNPPHSWRGAPAHALSDIALARIDQMSTGG